MTSYAVKRQKSEDSITHRMQIVRSLMESLLTSGALMLLGILLLELSEWQVPICRTTAFAGMTLGREEIGKQTIGCEYLQ